jgi:chloride channel protein, CIC family
MWRVSRFRNALRSLRGPRGIDSALLPLARLWPSESQRLFVLTLVLGGVCGLLAVAFHGAIGAFEGLLIDRALKAEGSAWMVWTVVTPTLAGLGAGAILTFWLPGARGSGIPQVKQAFAVYGGRVRFRDAAGKFFLSAFQIGSGASLGREGPTVHICAGATSLLGRLARVEPGNVRKLTPVGVAAGIAAAFNAPIAAVTFTIEEIVGTLDQTILTGVVVAAALAAVIERGILGVHPVMHVAHPYGLDHVSSLVFFALLGLAAAVVSVLFTDSLLWVRRGFRSVKLIPSWAHPGIGGMVTGLVAVGMLSWLGASGVTGGGYQTLGQALSGDLGLKVLVALCGAKLIATVASYSSGGAGGIFAPSLFIGAMLGGAVGHLDVAVLHHHEEQLGAFALVGMGAVFAGVIRAPITSVLIIFEMTGGYGLVLPLMLANMTSYVIARRLRPVPIYEALLAQDGIKLPESNPGATTLGSLRVGDAMNREVISCLVSARVGEVQKILEGREFSFVPVVRADKTVVGIFPLAGHSEMDPHQPVAPLVHAANIVRETESLSRAVVRMSDQRVRQLIVVDEATERLLGVLSITDVIRHRALALRDSRVPENDGLEDSSKKASSLMLSTDVIQGSIKLHELVAKRRSGGPRALLVRVDDEYRVILPEHLHEFARDPRLEKMLVAVDVARPAVLGTEEDDVETMVRAFRTSEEESAVILDSSGKPVGVVTRSLLATFLLEQRLRKSGSPLSSSD